MLCLSKLLKVRRGDEKLKADLPSIITAGPGMHYSGPSVSGHSQQRPPSLMWPQIFAAATIIMIMNAFNSPSHQRPPL